MKYGKRLKFQDRERGHEHCYHLYQGPIWMVIPDGHVLEKCCKCEAIRLVHVLEIKLRDYEF